MPAQSRSESQSILGEGFRSDNRRPRTFRAGRRCSFAGCSTLLSIYNESDRCSTHETSIDVSCESSQEPALQTA